MKLRDTKLFIKCLLSSLLLLVLVGAVCLIGISALSVKSNNVAIKVAIVDNEDSVISRILINAVKSTEYLSKILQTEKMDTENAIASTKNGETHASVILPEDFVGDILKGREAKGKIYISDSVEFYAQAIESIAKFGEKLLVSGQYGVFTGEHFIKEFPQDLRSDYLNKINTSLIEEALSSNDRYAQTEMLPYLDTQLPTESYYAMCWALALLFLISIFFSDLYLHDMTPGMLGRLKSYNVGCFKFFLPKTILMFLFRSALFIPFIIFSQKPDSITVTGIVAALVTSLYITIVCTALIICFKDSITANAIVAIGGMLLCGGIVPRQILPEAITLIGDFTPFGAAKLLASPSFGASMSMASLPALIYVIVSVFLIYRKYSLVVSGGDI